MLENTVGFVGAGRIARILLEGWQRAGLELPAVVAADVDPAAFERLPKLAGRLTAALGDVTAAARQDIVFVAVHPPVLPAVLGQIAGALRNDAIVVSLAPKFTIAKLRAARRFRPNCEDHSQCSLDRRPRVQSYRLRTVAHCGRPITVKRLLGPLGAAPEVAENLLEAYAVITAMGPTYFWPQLVELTDLAETFGLSRGEATAAVRQMVDGATATLTDSGLPADEVLDLVPVRPWATSTRRFARPTARS